MKIRYSSISKFLIYTLVLMHLCYFLIIFGGTTLFADSYVSKSRMMLFVIMMLLAMVFGLIYSSHGERRFINFELAILFVSIVRGYIGALIDGYAWDNALSMVNPYIYSALAIVIFDLLINGQWKFETLLSFLVIATSVDTVVRAIDSVYENLAGSLLWSNIVYGEMGYRNDLYRIQPSTLDLLVIPTAYYLYLKSTSKARKTTFLVCVIINFLYTLVIWQARSALIYKVLLLIVLLVLNGKLTKRKLIMLMIGGILVVAAINTTYVESLIDSFSVTNKELGGSTTARFNAMGYYLLMYSESPVLGVGLLTTVDRYAAGGGMLEDIGFIYGLVQLGIPIILFYITVFIRGIFVAVRIRKKDIKESQLCIGLTLIYVMFGINIDMFYGFSFSVPFYLAIVEYVNWKHRTSTF